MFSNFRSYYMYLFLFLLAGIIFIPLYVSIAGGFKTIGDLRTNSLGLPTEWIVGNYTSLLVDNKFWLFTWNSVLYAAGTTFHQSLQNQLNTFSLDDDEKSIAEFLVGSIDDSGYIRRDLIDLMDDLAFTQNVFTTEGKIEKILLNVVQKLDPIGVGARDLKECLVIQLKTKEKN